MNLKIFKPDKRKLALFAIFSMILYLGMVQAWAFCKECNPKPFLYDAIAPFPFWILMVYLSLPMLMIFSFFPLQSPLAPIIVLAYFYFASCIIAHSFMKYEKEFSKKVIYFWAIIFAALNLQNIIIPLLLSGASGEQMIVSATQPSLLEAAGFYLAGIISFAFYAYFASIPNSAGFR